ncbi:hypothetical protein WUBG_13198, partial [Wuchereria bancrofti]
MHSTDLHLTTSRRTVLKTKFTDNSSGVMPVEIHLNFDVHERDKEGKKEEAMATAEERKLELERKKQKLAEIREEKRRREEERRRNLLKNANLENGAVSDLPKTFSQKDLEEILEPLGISAQPQIESSITPNNIDHRTVDGVRNNQKYLSVPRTQKLAVCETQIISVPPKDA